MLKTYDLISLATHSNIRQITYFFLHNVKFFFFPHICELGSSCASVNYNHLKCLCFIYILCLVYFWKHIDDLNFWKFTAIKWKLYFVIKTQNNLGNVIENNTTIRKPILMSQNKTTYVSTCFGTTNDVLFVKERPMCPMAHLSSSSIL